jgi:hypothetical protein
MVATLNLYSIILETGEVTFIPKPWHVSYTKPKAYHQIILPLLSLKTMEKLVAKRHTETWH